MQLTQFTDYSLRVLLYVGLKKRRSTVKEISENFNISQNHLLKVVHRMGQWGWITNHKGRGGGIELADVALDLTVAEIVERTEPNMELLECFNPSTNTCPLIGVCRLEKLLIKAQTAFISELKKVTVRELLLCRGPDPRLARLNIL